MRMHRRLFRILDGKYRYLYVESSAQDAAEQHGRLAYDGEGQPRPAEPIVAAAIPDGEQVTMWGETRTALEWAQISENGFIASELRSQL